jgi:WXXGXW repeat (2 copies)
MNPSHRSPRAATRRAVAAASIALLASLSACVVAPARPRYMTSELVTVEPPVAVDEVVGVAPGPGYVWTNGYWNWYGGRHVWVGGRWVEGRPGYRWTPHAWVREGGGWHLREGYWAR